MSQNFQVFLVGTDEAEQARLVKRALTQAGYQVLKEYVGMSDQALLTTARREPQEPGTLVVSCRHRMASHSDCGATEVRCLPVVAGGMDLALPRRLAAVSGGLSVALAVDRVRGEYAVAAFYAGHTVEVEGRDLGAGPFAVGLPSAPSQDASIMEPLLYHWIEMASGMTSHDLRGQTTTPAQAWLVRRAAGGAPPLAEAAMEASEPLARMVLSTDEDRFRAVAEGLAEERRDGWRWLARVAATGQPFVLVERRGELNGALLGELVHGLGCAALAVAFAGPGDGFGWRLLTSDGTSLEGHGFGAEALIATLGSFSHALGEPAGVLRWPSGIAGEPL